jgi:hypothetical protein
MPKPAKPVRNEERCLASFEQWREELRSRQPRPLLAPPNRPPYDALRKAFAHVPRPAQVKGDPWGIDAPTEQVEWLLA